MSKVIYLPIETKEIYDILADMELKDRRGYTGPEYDQYHARAVQKFALEGYRKAYTPSGELGSNPTPRVSSDIVDIGAPHLFGPSGFISRNAATNSEAKKAKIAMKAAITHLAQIYMSLALKRKTKQTGPDLSDLRDVSDFQYRKSAGGKSTSEEMESNRQVDLNRYVRILVETSIATVLHIVFCMSIPRLEGVLRAVGFFGAKSSSLRKTSTRRLFASTIHRDLMKVIRLVSIPEILGGQKKLQSRK